MQFSPEAEAARVKVVAELQDVLSRLCGETRDDVVLGWLDNGLAIAHDGHDEAGISNPRVGAIYVASPVDPALKPPRIRNGHGHPALLIKRQVIVQAEIARVSAMITELERGQ